MATLLLQRLRTRAASPAAPDAVPVALGGRDCGWATPAAAAVLSPTAAKHGDTPRLYLPTDDAGLAAVAAHLHQAGIFNGWRGELLDITDANGTVLGRIERAAMRPLGLRTRAVHLNAFAPDGRLWIARRALHKSTDPGQWDTLVGGLVAADETPAQALLRESDEEAGLTPTDLAEAQVVGGFEVTRHVPEGYQVEAVTVTDCVLPAACRPANRDGEVEQIRLAGFDDVLAMIEADRFTAEAALSILMSWEAQGAAWRSRSTR